MTLYDDLIDCRDEGYQKFVNSTGRYCGAVGTRALIPRYVPDFARLTDKILDFGAGKKAIHTQMLREKGFDVDAYDIGENGDTDFHQKNALSLKYDFVYASNVLNVQPSVKCIELVIDQISRLLPPGGLFLCNFPEDPRHNDGEPLEVGKLLEQYFHSITWIKKGKNPIWLCCK